MAEAARDWFSRKIEEGVKAARQRRMAAWMDDLVQGLNRLRQASGVGQAPEVLAAAAKRTLENEAKLRDIQLLIFYQFLLGSIKELRAHRIMRPPSAAYNFAVHPAAAMYARAKKLRKALLEAVKLEGMDHTLTTALSAQKVEAVRAYVEMKFQALETVYAAEVKDLDSFFAFHETTLVRTLFEKVWDNYADAPKFEMDTASLDVMYRLAMYQYDMASRIRTLTKLYRANGDDLEPLKTYYDQLYQTIENGT